MKPILAFIGGFAGALAIFAAGGLVAMTYLSARPVIKQGPSQNIAALWSREPRQVDPSRQNLQRVAAATPETAGKTADPAPAGDEERGQAAPERRPDHHLRGRRHGRLRLGRRRCRRERKRRRHRHHRLRRARPVLARPGILRRRPGCRRPDVAARRGMGATRRLVQRPLPLLPRERRHLSSLWRRPPALRVARPAGVRRRCRDGRRRHPHRRLGRRHRASRIGAGRAGDTARLRRFRRARARHGTDRHDPRPHPVVLRPLPLLSRRGQQLSALWRRPPPAMRVGVFRRAWRVGCLPDAPKE